MPAVDGERQDKTAPVSSGVPERRKFPRLTAKGAPLSPIFLPNRTRRMRPRAFSTFTKFARTSINLASQRLGAKRSMQR